MIGLAGLIATAAIVKGAANWHKPEERQPIVALTLAPTPPAATRPQPKKAVGVVVPASLTLPIEELQPTKPAQPLLFSLWPAHLNGNIDLSGTEPEREAGE